MTPDPRCRPHCTLEFRLTLQRHLAAATDTEADARRRRQDGGDRAKWSKETDPLRHPLGTVLPLLGPPTRPLKDACGKGGGVTATLVCCSSADTEQRSDLRAWKTSGQKLLCFPVMTFPFPQSVSIHPSVRRRPPAGDKSPAHPSHSPLPQRIGCLIRFSWFHLSVSSCDKSFTGPAATPVWPPACLLAAPE